MLDTYSIIRGCIQIEKFKTSVIVPLDSYILKGSAWLLLKFRCVYCTVECRRARLYRACWVFPTARMRTGTERLLIQTGWFPRNHAVKRYTDYMRKTTHIQTHPNTTQHKNDINFIYDTSKHGHSVHVTSELIFYLHRCINKYDPMLILHVQ